MCVIKEEGSITEKFAMACAVGAQHFTCIIHYHA